MRSAGCAINDWADKNLDAKVNRTKLRPLAANVLTLKQALILIVIFLGIGVVVWLFLNPEAKYISLIGGFMMVIYPFMKRITYWPQLFLGFTFNIGLFIAIAHCSVLTFSWRVLCLYGSLILWTVFYDTIYAFADITDDLKANSKSMSMIMNKAPKLWLTLINVLLHFLLLLFFGVGGILPVILGIVFLQSLLNKWNPNDSQNCIKIFSYCHFWGLIEWFWCEIIRVIAP